MSAINVNEPVVRSLCGWQEIYTDFDAWILKFSKNCSRGTHSDQSEGIVRENYSLHNVTRDSLTGQEQELGLLMLQDLLVKGLRLDKVYLKKERMLPKKDLFDFLHIFQNGGEFFNYDYVLIKLLCSRKYYYQYTRSKL